MQYRFLLKVNGGKNNQYLGCFSLMDYYSLHNNDYDLLFHPSFEIMALAIATDIAGWSSIFFYTVETRVTPFAIFLCPRFIFFY
jgi:hypothetical protein